MKRFRRIMCVLLSFILAFSMIPVDPKHGIAVESPSDAPATPTASEEPASERTKEKTPAGQPPNAPESDSAGAPAKTPANDGHEQAQKESSSWKALQKAIDDAENGTTIVLDADYTAAEDDAGLVVPADKSIVIDLAGHALERNLNAPSSDGYVIAVRGTLSVVDSTANAGTNGTGRIAGGRTQNGGGIYVEDGGSLSFEAGSITNNEADDGGGIYVASGASLRLAGGSIVGNAASGAGGGVAVAPGARAVSVEGAPVVRDNGGSGSGANVYLPDGFVLTVSGELLPGASLGVALETGTGALTNGYGANNGEADPALYFAAEDGLRVALNEGEAQVASVESGEPEQKEEGEALTTQGSATEPKNVDNKNASAKNVGSLPLKGAEETVQVSDWQGLQNAINEVGDGQTITLAGDVTAGDGNGSLAVQRPDVSFAIDLAGHTINRNLASKNEDNKGHVLDVYQGTLTIKDSSANKNGKISGGYDENGGGIVIGGDGHLRVESGIITGNSADNGGGIFVYGTLEMTGGSVVSNTGGDCGGIYNHGGTISLKNVNISSNHAVGAGGAGINNKGTATLEECVISSNVANAEGGGIYTNGDASLTATNCSFTQNATNYDGGGVCSYGATTLASCTLNENTAQASGGAIRVHGGTTTLDGTALTKNTAAEFGGGIYCNNEGVLKILSSSSIEENVAYKGGGGVFVASQTGEVQVGSGVVVSHNQANNIYLMGDRRLTVVDKLNSGTSIGVSLENLGGTFTTGFKDKNPDVDPGSVFVAEPGYSILKDGDGEARVVTSDWIVLQAQIEQAGNGATITLDRSWQAADENTALVIPANKSITIDLNGYTIDRHRSSYTDGGEVFTVLGTLGIVDSPVAKKGVVRGGYGAGGGFVVKDGGTLKLQGGTVTGNHAANGGGGVRVERGGTLNTYGGSISGNVSDADGGGVYNGGTFTNAVCTINSNTANGLGGGVYTSGPTTFNSGSVSSNTSNGSGGGICVDAGTLAVNKGTPPVSISSNVAKSGGGGGIYIRGDAQGARGTANLDTCEITGNSISDPDGNYGDGGGIYVQYDGSASLKDTTITGNNASNHGGGVYVGYSGSLSVLGAPQVTNNAAAIGKNILGDGDGPWLTIGGALVSGAHLDVLTGSPNKPITSGFTAQGCTIDYFTTNDVDHNQLEVREGELYLKQAEGGTRVTEWAQLQEAIKNAASGETIVLDANVTAMTAEGDKRLIVEDGKNITIDLNGKQLHRNADEPEGGDGRVLEVDGDSTLTIKDSIGTGYILGGYADDGGGIYIHEGSTVNLLGGAVMNNRATEDGGGIYVDGTLNTTGGAITRNIAGDNGGGIYAEDDGNLSMEKTVVSYNTSHNEGGGLDIRIENERTIKSCQFIGNKAEDDHGGGIYLSESSLLLTLQDCVVDNNLSDGGHEGGGIYVDDGRLIVNGGTISRNRAKNGGGIYNYECAIVLNGTTLLENTTYDEGKGAGIFNKGSCQTTGCAFNGNAAEGLGGGIYTEGDDYLTVTNCSFQNNESKESSGGAIYSHRATTLTSCTFTGNKAYVSGGALYIDCDTSIVGGTFEQNEAVSHGGAICAANDSTMRLDGQQGP